LKASLKILVKINNGCTVDSDYRMMRVSFKIDGFMVVVKLDFVQKRTFRIANSN
jgi:hypothetical protein